MSAHKSQTKKSTVIKKTESKKSAAGKAMANKATPKKTAAKKPAKKRTAAKKVVVPKMPPKLPPVIEGELEAGYKVSKYFPKGLDPEIYIEKAFALLRKTYPWAQREHMCHKDQFVFEVINGKYQLVKYFPTTVDKGKRIEYSRDIPWGAYTEKKAVDMLVSIGENWVINGIRTVAKHKVKIPRRYLLSDWRLEHYEFNKLENGYYTIDVQAGNSYTGANRTFIITPADLKGTFEDFLDRYYDIVSPAFGLAVEDLAKDEKLKEFLGF